MSVKYQYTISTDTANGKVSPNQLEWEISQANIGVVLDYTSTNIEPDKLDIYMANALTIPQHNTLTAVVAAHLGIGYVSTLNGAMPLISGLEKDIIGDIVWDLLEGLLTTPSFFVDDASQLSQISARIVGEYKAVGGTSELGLLENVEGAGDEEKINPVFQFPDTGGVWTRFKVDSNIIPRVGKLNVYCTRCRLNGSASLSLRYATISMIKTITS